jgi:hypothetical protein
MLERTTLRLRVAMVWSQTLHAEQVLDDPRDVVLGYGDNALFPLPEAQAARGDITLLTPVAGGYTLHLPPGARGAVWINGQRREVRDLLERQPSMTLSHGDYGVVSLGAASYFFQQVELAPTPKRALTSLDGDAVMSFGLSTFMHACVIALMLLAQYELPYEESLEVKPELLTKFMVTPQIEPEPEQPSKPSKEDAAPKKKDDGGGKKARKDEGKFGRKDTQKKEHEIEGPVREEIAAKVRGIGLLGAIAGGDSLKGVLNQGDVGALLGGLGSARTDLGAGNGGRGLRGVGSGGGGDGPGSLMGGGGLGTGLGAGRGRGKGGGGGVGTGGGSGRGEAKVSVTPGTPQVSGYLSAEQINRVVKANQAALRYCYETEVQRAHGLKGKIVIQWRVDRAGLVPMAKVASTTMNNAAVEGCLVRQVKKWHFPKPDGGEVQVMYPFIFGIGG